MKFPLRNKITTKEIKTLDLDRKYEVYEMYGIKPDGFWYACGSDWYEYIYKGHDDEDEEKKYLYKINLKQNVKIYDLKIKDKNKIFCINNVKLYDAFCDEYKFNASYFTKEEKSQYLKFIKEINWNKGEKIAINWIKVKKDYGGIEIFPYLDEKRYDLWYNWWDVASGCIWNLKPILKNVQLVGTFV